MPLEENLILRPLSRDDFTKGMLPLIDFSIHSLLLYCNINLLFRLYEASRTINSGWRSGRSAWRWLSSQRARSIDTNIDPSLKTLFQSRFDEMKDASSTYWIVVIEDLVHKQLLATGTLVIEKKFTHSAGKVWPEPHSSVRFNLRDVIESILTCSFPGGPHWGCGGGIEFAWSKSR